MPSTARERELNDRLWERVRPLLPPPAPRPKGGRPRADDRACFEGIVFVLRNGLRWKDVPQDRFPSGPICWRRHAEWTGDGVWEAAWRAVRDELPRPGFSTRPSWPSTAPSPRPKRGRHGRAYEGW